MWANLGFYLLFLSCLVSLYGTIGAFFAAKWQLKPLYQSVRLAATGAFVLTLGAATILIVLLFSRDYSVAYIAKNSSNDLPTFYTFTAFWSSLEGSHFLWTLLMSLCCVIAHWTASKENEHIIPYVSMSLQAVLTWMFFLAITVSDPFLRMLPAPPDGSGMNALLQNFYMAFHPPSLFSGYTASSVPFAYGIAALCFGDITEGWLKTVRRWSLVTFVALTTGVILGGRWAYVELGWAGYWAWDPVENSSFLPWLFNAALLHSLIVQDKLGHLKKMGIFMAFLTFFFSFFGTFITRSGVISSVHSFAESNIGINYLIFLSVLLLFFLLLYAFRAPYLLPATTDKIWGVSRESALAVTLFLLLTFAAIVSIGTLFPIVSEAISGQRVSIQAPYFNAFAPYLGLGLIITMGIGNLLRFQSGKISGGAKMIIVFAVLALIPTAIFAYFGQVFKTPKPFLMGVQLVGIELVFWCVFSLLYDFYIHLKEVRFNSSLLLKKQLGWLGALIAHLGFLVAILGFLGNFRGISKVVNMQQGDRVSFAGYEFDFAGMRVLEEKNSTIFAAELQVSKNTKPLGKITPGRSKYPTKAELLHEVGVMSFFWADLYVVLSDFDKQTGKSATMEIHVNPTVRLVWISAFIMVFGGLLSLFDNRRGNRSYDALIASWKT